MAGRPRKVSFVLQFTESGDSGADAPQWRGALEEVESGERRHVTTSGALLDSLASHGVDLPPDLSNDACPECGALLARQRGTA
jgi:hypothetical protein